MTETERFKNFFSAILFLKPVIDVKNIIANTGKGEGQVCVLPFFNPPPYLPPYPPP